MAESNQYKVVISGGGTGGHIYPAIAIANALKELMPGTQILFVGAQGRMEMEKVPAAGYKIEGLWISGIQRRLTFDNILFPVKVLSSYRRAKRIIREFKPDIAIGVGGYASFPLLFAASRMGVPTLIQEQNGYAGVANKFLASKAEKICVAYEGMEKFFPIGKLVLTGNPVRKDIVSVDAKKQQAYERFGLDPGKKTLLVIGGSLGARTINESIDQGLEKLEKEEIQILWQTGKWYINQAEKRVEDFKNVKVFDFIYEMDLAYAAADMVISRAGALSISELSLVGKPVILVPSPNVAEDHQTKNAMALVQKDAALLIKDETAREHLVEAAINLFIDSVLQERLGKNIQTLGRPDAAMEIAGLVSETIETAKSKK